MTPQEIIAAATEERDRSGPDARAALYLIRHLAERVAALESREEVRHRIEPIMRGEKPEKGLGTK